MDTSLWDIGSIQILGVLLQRKRNNLSIIMCIVRCLLTDSKKKLLRSLGLMDERRVKKVNILFMKEKRIWLNFDFS